MKPRIYVETSVISYLAARPSRYLVMAAHQEVTRQRWQERRAEFDLFYSEAVRQEAAMGGQRGGGAATGLIERFNFA